jgi:hypothetical protein
MAYKRYGDRIDPELCRVGRPPVSPGTGLEVQRTISYLMQWHQQEAVMSSSGIPDKTYMLDAPNMGGVFHFGVPFADRVAGAVHDRQYGILVRWWKLNTTDPATGLMLNWELYLDRDFAGGPDEVLVGEGTGYNSDATYGEQAPSTSQRCWFSDADGDPLVIPSNAGAFWHAAVRVVNMMVASLSVFPFPYSPPLTLAQEQLPIQSFVAGRVIRGHDAGVCEGSIGTAMRLIGDGGIAEESCEALGRRLLWSWCHGVGLYIFDAVVAVKPWDGDIRIEPRGLAVGYTDGWCWPLLYITADEDCVITITNNTFLGAPTWVFTVPAGGYAVPTQIDYTMGVPATGLQLDPTAVSFLTVEVVTPADVPSEVLIHSLFIWEGDGWQ